MKSVTTYVICRKNQDDEIECVRTISGTIHKINVLWTKNYTDNLNGALEFESKSELNLN